MIIAIDGPAGAGKSTIARRLAERLGFAFLDTGAMYRAVALVALRRGLGDGDANEIARIAQELSIDFDGVRTLVDGEDVSPQIRTPEVTQAVYLAADNASVRERLVELQRAIAGSRDIVTEGRDQGTVAFPDAEAKIFLTASREERARRRCDELQSRGEAITYEAVLANQDARDQRDAKRKVGALRRAPDAVEVSTDGLSLEQVVDRLESLVGARRRTLAQAGR